MESIKDYIARLEISNLARYREEIIVLVVIVAATLFFHKYVYLKNVAEMSELDLKIQIIAADVNKISAEVKEAQRVAERLKEAMEKLKDMEERFAITQSKLPSDKQLSSILKGLVEDDVKRGIKFTSLRPMPLEPKAEYFRLPFQIVMQARFQSFGEYLEKIEEMPRIVTVENFRIDAKEENHPLLSIQLFMNTYVLGGQ